MYQGFTKLLKWMIPIIAIVLFSAYFLMSGTWRSKEVIEEQKPPSQSPAQTSTSTENTQSYRVIPQEVVLNKEIQHLIAQNPGKIQIIEFFSYGCYGCMRWHRFIDEWAEKHKQKAAFYRFPIVFNTQWEPFAKAYYVVKALGKNHELDQVIFKALHVKHSNLSDETELSKFFVEQGVPEKEFSALYNSFTVDQEMQKAKNLAFAYKITLSPSVILNTPSKSYIITPDLVHGDGNELLTVLDRLASSTGER